PWPSSNAWRGSWASPTSRFAARASRSLSGHCSVQRDREPETGPIACKAIDDGRAAQMALAAGPWPVARLRLIWQPGREDRAWSVAGTRITPRHRGAGAGPHWWGHRSQVLAHYLAIFDQAHRGLATALGLSHEFFGCNRIYRRSSGVVHVLSKADDPAATGST